MTSCEKAHPREFATAAASLTRDRAAKFAPVNMAILGVCLSIALKYVYLERDDVNKTNPQQIDIWSLSSSLMMVHIIPNVLLASVVGVQQSRYTAQRILEHLEETVRLGTPVVQDQLAMDRIGV